MAHITTRLVSIFVNYLKILRVYLKVVRKMKKLFYYVAFVRIINGLAIFVYIIVVFSL